MFHNLFIAQHDFIAVSDKQNVKICDIIESVLVIVLKPRQLRDESVFVYLAHDSPVDNCSGHLLLYHFNSLGL